MSLRRFQWKGVRLLSVLFFALLAGNFSALWAESPENISPLRPVLLETEFKNKPIGIDTPTPRLSWQFSAEGTPQTDAGQTAYRIRAARSVKSLQNATDLLWDSGWIDSSESTGIRYAGEPLVSNQHYFWNVQIRDRAGLESQPSPAGEWITGLLDASEWTAKWIGREGVYAVDGDGENRPFDPWFRKKFTLAETPKEAYLHLASIGFHEVYVNGLKVDDAVLSPGVSNHNFRARYLTYDIARMLTPGENVIAVWLGTGWSIFPYYGETERPAVPMFIAQAEIKSESGETTRLETGPDWKTAESNNKLLGHWKPGQFGGEYQDGRIDITGWNLVNFDDSAWENASVYDSCVALSAQKTFKNCLTEVINAQRIDDLGDNVWRVDMGKNFAGFLEFEVRGNGGELVEFQFSEYKDQPQTFNLFSRYQLDETGRGTFDNRFNYGSGRWITVKGLPKAPQDYHIRGWSVRTDNPRAASFECSDDLQNWIYKTVLWTFDNLSVGGYIVDCPQRERMGYGGDAHATCETGMFNYDLRPFYEQWMEDWRDSQGWEQPWTKEHLGVTPGREKAAETGTLPNTAPTYFGGGGPAWGGIVVFLPWAYYQQYGDTQILADNFDLMVRWLDFIDAHVENGLLNRYGDQWNFLGDWLWPGAPNGPNSDKEDTLCFNNIYRIYNLNTAVKIAETLGKTAEANHWRKLAEEGRKAVHEKYYHAEDASYFDGSPSILAAALIAEIPPAELRESVMKRLETEILVNDKGHIGSGITGGAILFKLLRQEGRSDLIYSMTSQKEYPGWGFMRENDATTIWEAWEVNRPGHSLLHSSYLYPGAWFIDSVLGIQSDPEGPGFKKIVIRPPRYTDTDLRWAKGHYDSVRGKISVSWEKSGSEKGIVLKTSIPANTSATVYVPADGKENVIAPAEAKWLRDMDGYSVYGVPSGSFEFRRR